MASPFSRNVGAQSVSLSEAKSFGFPLDVTQQKHKLLAGALLRLN